MPHIFDNIDQKLAQALIYSLQAAYRADFCVGYFNLRGWSSLDQYVEAWPGGDDRCCRLLVGMHATPDDEHRRAYSLGNVDEEIDMSTLVRRKSELARMFRQQLMRGAPTNADEAGLRRLAEQLRQHKLVVKVLARGSLHAKLYLLFREDAQNPNVGYVGSSNLTLPGLSGQGELNVDVLDDDACQKLARWFEDRWNDRWCVDISDQLIEVIEESWAGREPTPYEIYLKMAYHLSQEARAGLNEFSLPAEFQGKLFDFQAAAVRIAAHHLNRRGGVLIGDVVGLGKTLMATALARIFEEDFGISTLIICPPTLKSMWSGYVDEYGLRAKVMSSGLVTRELAEVPARFRLVILDESQNLRNPEGRRYRAIKDYIAQTESRCILLSATPYNKSYLDLSAQLRLFVPEDEDIGIRPEHFLRKIGDVEFDARYQVGRSTLAAFEKSEHPDDWRELMRLYMVRRTRSFIQAHYAAADPQTGRKYLTLADGTRFYFPRRTPRTLTFDVCDADNQYASLYSEGVVDVIGGLRLPRYGLGNYQSQTGVRQASPAEKKLLDNLSRAGKRLIGYSRTNLFKRLESSGHAFILSLDRHILRNYIFLHAIKHGLPLPIGTQDAAKLDPGMNDADVDDVELFFDPDEDIAEGEVSEIDEGCVPPFTPATYQQRAACVYDAYRQRHQTKFKWLRPTLFADKLRADLTEDAQALMRVLSRSGPWRADQDQKLERLRLLVKQDHPNEKLLIFTQFADTVNYLTEQLQARGVTAIAGVTGQTPDPAAFAHRFSPVSNEKNDLPAAQHLRVLIATDVLSEGQNLQDSAIVVNYDLPWAIIRLVQRAGRVDRIGQQAEEILCYSFLPAEGVERIIRLRERVRQRLQENGEVIGSDEQFFGDEHSNQELHDLYTEKSDILDRETDTDVDLGSLAYQIWHDAIQARPELRRRIENLPDVVFSTRAHTPAPEQPAGVLVYLKTAEGADALGWYDTEGRPVTHSQAEILRIASCAPNTPTLPRQPRHHDLVQAAIERMGRESRVSGGALGPRTGARARTYHRLNIYLQHMRAHAPLFVPPELERVVDLILGHPLREEVIHVINRQIKAGVSDEALAELVINLYAQDRLCVVLDEDSRQGAEPRIICSLGLAEP